MHRRARHLNPVAAGATSALDARFIAGLADGASVSSWASRAGASLTFTQATTARQPIFTLRSQGGQPSVKHVAGSNQWMSTTQRLVGDTTPLYTAFYVGTSSVSMTSNTSFVGGNSSTAFTFSMPSTFFAIVSTAIAQYSVSKTGSIVAQGRSGTAQIFAASRSPAGDSYATTTTGSTANLATNRNGSTIDIFQNGDSYAFSLIPVQITDSLRLRLLQSYAFSFKLQS